MWSILSIYIKQSRTKKQDQIQATTPNLPKAHTYKKQPKPKPTQLEKNITSQKLNHSQVSSFVSIPKWKKRSKLHPHPSGSKTPAPAAAASAAHTPYSPPPAPFSYALW